MTRPGRGPRTRRPHRRTAPCRPRTPPTSEDDGGPPGEAGRAAALRSVRRNYVTSNVLLVPVGGPGSPDVSVAVTVSLWYGAPIVTVAVPTPPDQVAGDVTLRLPEASVSEIGPV